MSCALEWLLQLVLLQSHSSLPSTCSSDCFAVLWRNRFVYIYRIGFVQGKIWDHPWINRSQNLGVGSSCEPSFPKVYCGRLVNSRLHNGDDRLGNKFVRAHKWGWKSEKSLWTHNPSPQYGKAQASEISYTFCWLKFSDFLYLASPAYDEKSENLSQSYLVAPD